MSPHEKFSVKLKVDFQSLELTEGVFFFHFEKISMCNANRVDESPDSRIQSVRLTARDATYE